VLILLFPKSEDEQSSKELQFSSRLRGRRHFGLNLLLITLYHVLIHFSTLQMWVVAQSVRAVRGHGTTLCYITDQRVRLTVWPL